MNPFFAPGGGGSSPPTPPDPQEWCTYDDLLLYLPATLDLRSRRIDSANCAEVIRAATAELADEMIARYDPIPSLTLRRIAPDATGRDAELRRLVGQDIPAPDLVAPGRDQFAAWVRNGGVLPAPPRTEAAARRTLAIILGRAATSDGSDDYRAARDFQIREAAARLESYSPRVDSDGDGAADWEVNPAGARVVFLGGGAGT